MLKLFIKCAVALCLGEGNGTPLQYFCLENPMDGGAWWAAVHGVTGSQTRLSNFTFTFHFHALEKEMATHSNILAWRIPWTGEPGGLPSLGSHRVGHNWSDFTTAALYLKKHNVYLNFKIFYCLKMPTIIWDFSKLYLFASRGFPIDAEDCWLIRVVVAEGWGGCGNFLK